MTRIVKWLEIIVCRWLLSIIIFAIFFMSLWDFVDYSRARGWSQAPAKIISIEKKSWPQNSNSVASVECNYQYVFKGQIFAGNRLDVRTFDQKISASLYGQLKERFDKGEIVPILVNPAKPSEAALFRRFEIEFIFSPLLALIWFGGLYLERRWNLRKRKLSENSAIVSK